MMLTQQMLWKLHEDEKGIEWAYRISQLKAVDVQLSSNNGTLRLLSFLYGENIWELKFDENVVALGNIYIEYILRLLALMVYGP